METMRRKRNKLGIRIVAIVLSILTVATLVMSILPSRAKAVTSLNQIETIKNNQAVFTILEIVPKEGSGSIGYYAEGQEPTRNWREELAAREGELARTTYMTTMFNTLVKRGLINADAATANADNYPLSMTGAYAEYVPWDPKLPENAEPLTLNEAESKTVTGVFTPNPNGSYNATTVGRLPKDSETALWVENAQYYEYAQGSTEGKFYYKLTFSTVNFPDATNVSAFYNVPLYLPFADHFKYEGTLLEKDNTFRVEVGTTYYYVSGIELQEGGFQVIQQDEPELTFEDLPEETTEPTEEVTEPTEETTEPTEETTEPTTPTTEAPTEPTETPTPDQNKEETTPPTTEAATEPTDPTTEETTVPTTEAATEPTDPTVEETTVPTTEAATEPTVAPTTAPTQPAVASEDTTPTQETQSSASPVPDVTVPPTEATTVPATDEEKEDLSLLEQVADMFGISTLSLTPDEPAPTLPEDAAALITVNYVAERNPSQPFRLAGVWTDPGTGEEKPETADFVVEQETYEYVGAGNGGYDFALTEADTEGAQSATISYNTIYITGGYTNNHWFLRHVFDMTQEEIESRKLAISVVTRLPDAEDLSEEIADADMIVLTAPLNYEDEARPHIPYANDLSNENAQEIRDAVDQDNSDTDTRQDVPLLVDSSLANFGERPNLSSFATDSIAQLANAAKGVSMSVYRFDSAIGPFELATNQFHDPFVTSEQPAYANYKQVIDEIVYENFLRKSQGFPENDMLVEEITVATCIRSIINFQGKRVENKKTSINVLDIEPSGVSGTNDGKPLTETAVRSWLPQGTQMEINITTMSTMEFVGNIDDITEKYDLIYIGADTSEFSVKDGITQYNDTSMNGLIYTNIGDTFTSDLMLSGLLDRDYVASSANKDKPIDADVANQFRFSGNDITQKKQKELESFAQSGLPIILADDLTVGNAAMGAQPIHIELTGKGYENRIELTAELSELQGVSNIRYTWYKNNNEKINNANGSTITVYENNSPYVKTGNKFYVVVSLDASNGKEYQGISNTVTIGEDGKPYLTPDSAVKKESDALLTLSPTNYNNNRTFSVDIPSDWTGVEYQWYKYDRGNSGKEEIENANGREYTVKERETYICEVSYNGKTYWSEQVERRKGNNDDNYIIQSNKDTTRLTLVVTPTQKDGEQNAKLTASVTLSDGTPYDGVVSYQWFNSGRMPNETRNTLELTNPNSNARYYCQVTITRNCVDDDNEYLEIANDGGKRFQYLNQGIFTVTPNGDHVDGQIDAIQGVDLALSPARIDSTSLMYKALSNVFGRENVMPAWMARRSDSTVIKYLNLSKPILNFAKDAAGNYIAGVRPTEYAGIDHIDDDLVPGRKLRYIFTITNPTDPTPLTSKYRVKLYIDQNGDGRHVIDEEVTDLTLIGGTNGELVAGTEYTMERTLSSAFSGMVAWKLVVEKVGQEDLAHTSDKGYTYIHPGTATPIRVLQLRHDSSPDLDSEVGTPAYRELYKAVSDAYKLSVTSVDLTELDKWEGDAGTNSTSELKQAKVYQELDEYDMLVLGFGDGYGMDKDISEESARAIVQFINSGKAVLFTHDNTSICNLPYAQYLDDNGKEINPGDQVSNYYWGFHFNNIIRNAVGLDRYGVTDPYYGGNKYNGLRKDEKSGTVANNYNDGTGGLLDAGYTIAYAPKTDFATVGDTQGFTNFALTRYYKNSSEIQPAGYKNDSFKATRDSQKATQTNQGQITQFPFNIPTELTINTTHEQYYQLNMNSDDIVVWYCLGGNRYSKAKNDAVNGYYIYNRGNVTYSGAGHKYTQFGGEYLNEAKLFVNTMIAAYRAGYTDPAVGYTSANGKADQTMLLVPVDTVTTNNQTELGSTSLDTDVYAHFMLQDTNLSGSKVVTAEFFMEDPQGTPDPDLGGAVVKPFIPLSITGPNSTYDYTGQGLASNTVYKVKLPAEVVNFDTEKSNQRTIYIKVKTTISKNGVKTFEGTGYDSLTLTKIGLLTLH